MAPHFLFHTYLFEVIYKAHIKEFTKQKCYKANTVVTTISSETKSLPVRSLSHAFLNTTIWFCLMFENSINRMI